MELESPFLGVNFSGQDDERSSVETCVNCCSRIGDMEIYGNPYEIKFGLEFVKNRTVLSNVYHLNCLDVLVENGGLSEEWALCENCASALDSLVVAYEQFGKLRHFQSLVSKSILKLDEIIERGLAGIQEHLSDEAKPGTQVRIKTEPRDFEEVVIPVDPYLQPANGTKGPWVRLERLRPEELPPATTSSHENLYNSHNNSPDEGGNFREDKGLDFLENSEINFSDEAVTPPKRRKRTISRIQRAFKIDKIRRTKGTEKKLRVQRKSYKTLLIPSNKEASMPPETDNPPETSDSAEIYENPEASESAEASEDGDEQGNVKKRKRIFKPTHGRFYELFYRRQLVHPFPCVYCEKDFDLESDRSDHLQSVHVSVSKPEFCAKCGKVFGDESRKKLHEPKCGTIPPGVHLPPYNCNHCNKEYPSWSKLSTHMRQVHVAERRFACDQCPYRTIAPSLLENHKQRVHTVTVEVQCPECQKVLKSQDLFRSHFDRMHGEGHEMYKQQLVKSSQRRRERRKPPLTSFVCPVCNVDFLTKNRLTNHRLAVHETEKKHMCDQCGKSFINPGRLRKHIEYTHTDERPFICDQCGKNFKSMDNLKCHIVRSHTEEGRLKYNEYTRKKNRHRQLVAMAQSNVGGRDINSSSSSSSSSNNNCNDNNHNAVDTSGQQRTPEITVPISESLLAAFQHSICE